MFSAHMLAKSRKLARLAEEGVGWQSSDTAWKKEWLETGRSVLRTLGKELELDIMRVWANKGGFGVHGETILMGMWTVDDIGIYLDTSSPSMYAHISGFNGPAFMWRNIEHMTDFSPQFPNRWLSYKQFNNPDDLVLTLKGMSSRIKHRWA